MVNLQLEKPGGSFFPRYNNVVLIFYPCNYKIYVMYIKKYSIFDRSIH